MPRISSKTTTLGHNDYKYMKIIKTGLSLVENIIKIKSNKFCLNKENENKS